MPRKPAVVERITQRVDEDFLGDLKQYPSQIKRWFIDNIIQRMLSYLMAWTEDGKAVRLRATADGKLKTVMAGGGFTEYDVKSGTAADTYITANTFEFTKPYSRVDILIEDNDAVVSFKQENGVWGSDITLKMGYHSIDFVILGIKVKNRVAAANADYEIVVYR